MYIESKPIDFYDSLLLEIGSLRLQQRSAECICLTQEEYEELLQNVYDRKIYFEIRDIERFEFHDIEIQVYENQDVQTIKDRITDRISNIR